MKRVIKNNYKLILRIIVGLIISISSVHAVEAYIESSKVSFDNKHTKTNNVQDSIDELYERSGIHKEKWVDKTLNGADPVLQDPLIPVEIKPNGEVYYANLNSEWYNYSEKRWANAVILIDNPSNQNYKAGDHILESDIESYFVWIPRYQYKVWNLGEYNKALTLEELKNSTIKGEALWSVSGNHRIIDIKFGTPNDIPKMVEPTAIDVYYTHPAFTLGDKNLNGIWVGKFETSGSVSNLLVKPGISSWRGQAVKTFFDAAKGYDDNYNNLLDSHMMKNTEWGAAAYLSHSQYGIGNEININNATDFKTGCSAAFGTNQTLIPGDESSSDDEAKVQPWNSPVGYLASTTGNISGIYDMSGGAYVIMAACIDGNYTDSGFNAETLANEMAQ